MLLHEYIGIAAYQLTGKISLFWILEAC
jgi:hypothetical protein